MLRFKNSLSGALAKAEVGLYLKKVNRTDHMYYTSNLRSRWNVVHVPLFEAILEVGRRVFEIIENIVLIALNVLGFLLIDECSLKDAIILAEKTINKLPALGTCILFTPIKIALQMLYILKDPREARAFN